MRGIKRYFNLSIHIYKYICNQVATSIAPLPYNINYTLVSRFRIISFLAEFRRGNRSS